MNVESGQRWECNEARADPDDVPEPHDSVPLWEDYPRFKATVDAVRGDVAELVVGLGNTHPRTPDQGDRIDIHVEKLLNWPRWTCASDTE